MTGIRTFALGAGAGFLTLAVFVQGFLPWLTPESRDRRVTRAVRTDLGDVRWVWYAAEDYTPRERRGREVYIREGCWYCHSQYVRPVTGEDRRWGPVSEAGEYHYDAPHLLSTRRIGPDLTRAGGKVGDGWHYAHHWDPRLVVPDSTMPAFRWLFDAVRIPVRKDGTGAALAAVIPLARYFTLEGEPRPLYPNAAGLAFVDPRGPTAPDGRWRGTPHLELGHYQGKLPELREVTVVVPTPDLIALVAYVQRLGQSRGVWRDVFEPQARPEDPPAGAGRAASRGAEVYERRCAGCHGARGDGNGPAATFLDPRPRDFTAPAFRFRSTPSGALPTDADLFRTLTRGVRGTAMPSWHDLPAADRVAVIRHLKGFAPSAWAEAPEPPIPLPAPPPASAALVARGEAVYRSAKCAECHGEAGRGDGPSAGQLDTDGGFPIRPTDLTRGGLKGGPGVADVYRTLSTGLNGTPMPSYGETLTDEERWALAYHVLALGAFRDGLTGAPLLLDEAARAALRRPGVGLAPDTAHDPQGTPAGAGRPRYRFGLLGGPGAD